MRKIIFYLTVCAILLCSMDMVAQMPSGQTASTVVTDVLAQLPAAESPLYHRLMQQLIETGTEGVTILAGKMNAPGEGDHAAVEYALSGIANFASGDEFFKNKMEQAFIAALGLANETEVKAFIIRQLAIVGSDACINPLSVYLTDEKLSSHAVSAIVSIGGGLAGKALQATLMRRIALSPDVQRQVIQALGQIQPPVEGTEELLKTMINTDDPMTKRVVLKALSRTGSKQSLAILAAAAASTGFKAEITDANGAYIQLIKRVYEQGDKKEALVAAQTLLRNATKSGATQIRIAALEILFYTQTDRWKILKTAIKDGDKTYRNAALKYASGYADKALYTELLKSLPKANTAEKIDMIYWIGGEALFPEKRSILRTVETGIEKTGIQTLIQLLNDTDEEVKQATIVTLGAMRDKSALPSIADILKRNDDRILLTAKQVLASFPDDISPVLARVVGQASDKGKVIIMELISGRKANAYFTMALEQTKNSSPDVKNAAFKALKDVVSEKDFIILCGMLETAEPSFVIPLQQAIASSITSLAPEKQMEMIDNRILQVGDSNKYLYDPVLLLIQSDVK